MAISQSAHMDWHTIPTLNTLAYSSLDTGNYQQAIDFSEQTKELTIAVGALRFLTIANDTLGSIYQDLNLLEKAEEVQRKGIKIASDLKSNFWAPRLKANLAITQMRQGNLGVEAQMQAALESAMSRSQQIHAVLSLEGLVELAVRRGEPEVALERAAEFLAMSEAGGMQKLVAQAHRWMGEANILQNDLETAENELALALKIAAKIGAARLKWDINAAFVNLYELQGNNKKSVKHKNKIRKIVAKIADNLEDPELKAGLPALK